MTTFLCPFFFFSELTIERVCLTAGKSVIGYLSAYNTDLYLSADESSVVEALQQGTLFVFSESYKVAVVL